MKRLNKPSMDIRTIVEDCANSYRNIDLRQRIINSTNYIYEKSNIYDSLSSQKSWHLINKNEYPAQLTHDEMTKLYTDKFVVQKQIREKYYDKIMSLCADGLCPICGIGYVSTLDHYLPKSIYPIYSITPSNLIPVCRDCNISKSDKPINSEFDAVLNPYYDTKLNEIWIEASISLQNNTITIVYNVIGKKPNIWSDIQYKRAKKHFEIFKLKKALSVQAISEIENNKFAWNTMLDTANDDFLKAYLEMQLESFERHDINSWRSVLYRALIANIDQLIFYLKNNDED